MWWTFEQSGASALANLAVISRYYGECSNNRVSDVTFRACSSMDQGQVEEEILSLLLTCKEGVGDDILIKYAPALLLILPRPPRRLPGVEPRLRAQAINKLLVDAKIDLFKSKEGLLYRCPTAPPWFY